MLKIISISSLFLFIVCGTILAKSDIDYRQTSPRQAFERATAVFSGKITEVFPAKQRLRNIKGCCGSISNDNGLQTADVIISKIYKRADAFGLFEGGSLTIYPNDRCKGSFKPGETWLFYVRYDDETFSWVINDCYRSQPIEEAIDDLEFIKALPGSLERARVSGRVLQIVSFATENEKAVYRPIVNAEIEVSVTNYGKTPPEKNTLSTRTDKRGFYEIYDLPDGFPSIDLKQRFENRYVYSEWFGDVETYYPNVKTSRGENFFVSPGFSFVKGKVLDETGTPAANIKVELLPVGENARKFYPKQAATLTDGSYSFQISPTENAGRYLVSVNREAYRDPRKPYAPTFFPGTTEERNARVIEIKNNQTLENIDVNVGRKLTGKTISGRAVFNNGQAVPTGKVTFDGTMNFVVFYWSEFSVPFSFLNSTDISRGNFSVGAVEGSGGKLQAELLFRRDKLEACLKRKLTLPADEKFVLVNSKPIQITANKNISDVSLKFLIPPCTPATETENDEYWASKFTSGLGGFTRYGKKIEQYYFETLNARKEETSSSEETSEYDSYAEYAPQRILGKSAMVLTGTVVKSFAAEKGSEKITDRFPGWTSPEKVVQIKIDKLFKPADIYGIETGDLISVEGGSDHNFKIGEKRLFALELLERTDSDVWRLFESFYPNPVGLMQGYIKSFESPATATSTRISGYVRREKYKNVGANRFAIDEPLAGIKILLMHPDSSPFNVVNNEIKKYITVVTDVNGYYEFDNLPSGKYWVLPSAPQYYYRNGDVVFGRIGDDPNRLGSLIDLSSQKEVGVDFDLRYRGEIGGRVTDENGNPIAQAMVRLLDPITLKTSQNIADPQRFTAITEGSGEYVFRQIPPGKYLLAVLNDPPRINVKTGFFTTFYPNTVETENAVPIEIAGGEKKTNVNITVSKRLPEKSISGLIEFPGDAIQNDVFLTFDGLWEFVPLGDKRRTYFSELKTKPFEFKVENARFQSSIPESSVGKLQAYTFIKKEKLTGCLKDQLLPAADENGFIKIYSTASEILATPNRQTLKLKFVVPSSCFEK
jgi:protocatechuate 3,4-dioxygenase beta subunit